MTTIKTYIDSNRERFLEEMFELMRIPSVSAKEENKPDMLRAAELLKTYLEKAGAEKTKLFPTAGNPVVYG